MLFKITKRVLYKMILDNLCNEFYWDNTFTVALCIAYITFHGMLQIECENVFTLQTMDIRKPIFKSYTVSHMGIIIVLYRPIPACRVFLYPMHTSMCPNNGITL